MPCVSGKVGLVTQDHFPHRELSAYWRGDLMNQMSVWVKNPYQLCKAQPGG